MEDYVDIVSDHSGNEEAYYSDRIDSDTEAELYSLIHHDTQDNSISLQDKSDFVENESVSLPDKSSSIENNSISSQNNLGLTSDNSVLAPANSAASNNTVNSIKNQKNSVRKNNQNYGTSLATDDTNFFSSDAIVNNNSLYFNFDSPVKKQKIQRNQVQSENSKRSINSSPAKRKSDVVSEILENIQLNKNLKEMQPENSFSKRKKSASEAESFVEVVDDSSDSDSDSSIMLLEPDQSNLQTNITKETVVLSSDSEGSDSSMEKSFSQACRKRQLEVSDANISSNNEDPWFINSEDRFRTKKQSNRYHDNAVITCSKCQLKGHSAKFCSVPKAMKCFFCGDYHSGMNCKNKICTKCFQVGHDRRRCFIRFIDTCELCRMRGHSERNCPDLWRRYHLTTSKGGIVKGNLNPHSPLYCYCCGSKGHYGAECMETRADRWSFPTWTSVISYKNPISVLRKENERNFRQEERNSYERNRFERTPFFHRRKGNGTFSNGTPTQNTKKKKNKNKSPKTPPNTNHQSATPVQNIIQKEVYFPRTPKMTPNLNTEGFSKKKRRKKQKEGDNLLRRQMEHRIGLQQRLGLPFPSTI